MESIGYIVAAYTITWLGLLLYLVLLKRKLKKAGSKTRPAGPEPGH